MWSLCALVFVLHDLNSEHDSRSYNVDDLQRVRGRSELVHRPLGFCCSLEMGVAAVYQIFRLSEIRINPVEQCPALVHASGELAD